MLDNPKNVLSPQILHALHADSVVIFPTETLYGIGCGIWCKNAVTRVFEIKGRAPNQPPPVLIANKKQLQTLTNDISPAATLLMEKFWPGSLTLILPARAELPAALCGFDQKQNIRTIAVRHTAHPQAAALCAALDSPIVATSANFSGEIGRAAQPKTLEDISPQLLKKADVVIDGDSVGGAPSTIVDCLSHPPRVLRPGAITLAELQGTLPDIAALLSSQER